MILYKTSKKPIDYLKAISFMEKYALAVAENKKPELLWFLEHNSVYTAGSSFEKNDIINNNINIVNTNRGGKITYHGIGQRIIYPIIKLHNKDIKKYIYNLEDLIIKTLANFNIKSYRKKDFIGIWVDHNNEDKKIAAIGVHIKKWVAYHGVAININTNLSFFDNIVPCGIDNFKVTSLSELGYNITYEQFDEKLKQNFNNILLQNNTI
jgi:lipoyl(octanoyl) transferase